MKTHFHPIGKSTGLIHKYYPRLGKHLPSPTLPDLAAEWYFTLSRIGIEGLHYYIIAPYELAGNKAEFTDCVAVLLAEVEQEALLEDGGREVVRTVREWHTLAILSPIEQFLVRARKIELWQNEQHQLVTREAGHEEWNAEYTVLLLALQRTVPSVKKRLLRAAYTELNRLLPTLAAGRPLEWQRLHDEGNPFFASALTATYVYSEFVPLRPTRTTTSQTTKFFFLHLHTHLFEKEWHVWQALILLAGALGEAAPPTPETFQEKHQPAAAEQPFLNTLAPGAPAAAKPASPYPWAEIEKLAENIELRKNGRFLVADNRIGAAGAGLIDALLDAGILSDTYTRPILYAAFSQHYGWSIKADRTKPTRTTWHQKARRELGLPDLKPPKKQV